MQILGLEYLRFEDGRLAEERESQRLEFQANLISTLVKGSLVASGEYEEKILFKEHFQPDDDAGSTGGDADTDLDYSEVEFGTPDMDEMALLESLLGDNAVTVSGAPLEGPGAVQVDREDDGPDIPMAYALEPPKEFALPEPDPDAEWT